MNIPSESLASKVGAVLDRNIVYSTVLNSGLVSASKLSRQIIDEISSELGVSPKSLKLDTVVKAVKRHISRSRDNGVHGKVNVKSIHDILGKSHLVVRSDLAVLCSKITAHLPEKLSKIIAYLYTKEDHVFHSSQASTAITLVFDECELEKVQEIINPEYTLYSKKGCAAIKVIAPVEIVNQPGVFAYVLNLFATSGINIIMITFSYTEMILIIDRQYEVKAFDILKNEIDRLRKISPSFS